MNLFKDKSCSGKCIKKKSRHRFLRDQGTRTMQAVRVRCQLPSRMLCLLESQILVNHRSSIHQEPVSIQLVANSQSIRIIWGIINHLRWDWDLEMRKNSLDNRNQRSTIRHWWTVHKQKLSRGSRAQMNRGSKYELRKLLTTLRINRYAVRILLKVWRSLSRIIFSLRP